MGELGLVGVDGRKGNSIVAEQLLLRLCWRSGLGLLLVLLLLLLLLQRVLLLPLL